MFLDFMIPKGGITMVAENAIDEEKIFDFLVNRFSEKPKEIRAMLRNKSIKFLSSSLNTRTIDLLKRLVGYGIKYPTDEAFKGWAKSRPEHFRLLHKSIIAGLSRCIGNFNAYLVISEVDEYMWRVRDYLREEEEL